MLFVFNPLNEEASTTIGLPLYYTGLTTKTTIIDAASTKFPVILPAGEYTWFIIK